MIISGVVMSCVPVMMGCIFEVGCIMSVVMSCVPFMMGCIFEVGCSMSWVPVISGGRNQLQFNSLGSSENGSKSECFCEHFDFGKFFLLI